MKRAWLALAAAGPGREAALVALLLLVLHPALLPDPRPVVGSLNDDGIYVALGRAIADGEGYHSTYLPRDPVQVRYPPGLPAVLALLWRVGGTLGTVATLAVGLNTVLVALAASLLYWIGRARLGLHPGLALPFVVGPFLLDPALTYTTLILSEPYFVAGWAAALVLAYRVGELSPGPRRDLAALAFGLTLAATALVRTQGVVLVPAMLASLAVKRAGRRAFAAATAGALVPLACWYWIHAGWVAEGPLSTAADEVSYLAWTGIGSVGEAIRILAAAGALNVLQYPVMFSFYFSDAVLAGFLLVTALGVLAVGGAVRRLRADPAVVLGTAVMAVLMTTWPGTQDRLVLPLLPFLGLLAASEVRRMLERAGTHGRAVLLVALGVATLSIGVRQVSMRREVNASMAAGELASFYTPTDYVRRTSALVLELSRWVRASTRPDDRIMVAMPAGVYLHAGRKALPAEPAWPTVGGRAARVPGAYLASQILTEQPTILVVHRPRRARAAIARDAGAIRTRCPGVLTPLETRPAGFPEAYRIRAAAECLEAIAEDWPDHAAARRAGTAELAT